jgi:hypothetical protein
MGLLLLSTVASLDVVSTLVFTTTIFPFIRPYLNDSETFPNFSPSYLPGSTLSDLPPLLAFRVLTLLLTVFKASRLRSIEELDPPFPIPGGKDKDSLTKDEIEDLEADETWSPFLARKLGRPRTILQLSNIIILFAIGAKAAFRLFEGDDPSIEIWLWWLSCGCAVIFSFVELLSVEGACRSIVTYFSRSRNNSGNDDIGELRNPLMGSDESSRPPSLLIRGSMDSTSRDSVSQSTKPKSDIGDKAEYKAGWSDLFDVCRPDAPLIGLAFIFLALAAVAQVYIPRFTGNILDAVGASNSGDDDNSGEEDNVWDVPGFSSNVRNLGIAAICVGLFSGLRGGVFTIVGARVNARLRTQLMQSLLAQDIGFFE